MLPLGTVAPHFNLYDVVSAKKISLNNLKGKKGTLIMFICNHCPYVVHVNKELVRLAHDYKNKEIGMVAISSNDIISYPQDAPELMKQVALDNQYPFPYLFDESQDIAKAYEAACTPDFYLFDAELKLIYRGQLDDSRPGNNIELTGNDLRNAINSLLSNTPISTIQKPSMGCNIKWK